MAGDFFFFHFLCALLSNILSVLVTNNWPNIFIYCCVCSLKNSMSLCLSWLHDFKNHVGTTAVDPDTEHKYMQSPSNSLLREGNIVFYFRLFIENMHVSKCAYTPLKRVWCSCHHVAWELRGLRTRGWKGKEHERGRLQSNCERWFSRVHLLAHVW